MGRIGSFFVGVLVILSAFQLSSAQGAGGGGFGGGGIQGRQFDSREVDQRIDIYLNGEELKSVLTPGEFVEYKIQLKSGQVLIAGSRSDAFDPALEVVGASEKVLASNDDRYPGNQSPLLLWRCIEDGDYRLRVRSFQNKAGGQAFTMFKSFDSIDVLGAGKFQYQVSGERPFLIRVPMKAGQIKRVIADYEDPKANKNWSARAVIFENGLPERSPGIGGPITDTYRAIVAPLNGDYYIFADDGGSPKTKITIAVKVDEISPRSVKTGALAPANGLALWELDVKAGEIVELSLTSLDSNVRTEVSEAPDFANFSLDPKKPKSNPFFPIQKGANKLADPKFQTFAKRAEDRRLIVIWALRDSKLWVVASSNRAENAMYGVKVQPAASSIEAERQCAGELKKGYIDYWTFDAKAGDVIKLSSSAESFIQDMSIWGPSGWVWSQFGPPVDKDTANWRGVATATGRYLVAVTSRGSGGGGHYTLSRQLVSPRLLEAKTSAKADISQGEVQVWKFTADPKAPLLFYWSWAGASPSFRTFDDKGTEQRMPFEQLDNHSQALILKVDESSVYLIVLVGLQPKSSYKLQLKPISDIVKT